MTHQKQLKLGFAAYGTGWDLKAWRLPEANNVGLKDPSVIVDVARIAERGKIDYVFAGSSLASEPTSLQRVFRWDNAVYTGYAAAVTRNVGFLISYNTSIEHPYLVARQLATADHFSEGRVGLNLVYGIDRGVVGRNFGKWNIPDNSTKYARAEEFTDSVYRLLYESWAEGYFADGKDGGQLIAPDAAAELNHRGTFFDIAGPLNTPPPLQQRIPLVHVGASAASLDIGARYADIRFSSYLGHEAGRAEYASHKARVKAAGRNPSNFLVLPGIGFYIGGTKAEARDKFRQVSRLETTEVIPAAISATFGVDLSRVSVREKAVNALNLTEDSPAIQLNVPHPYANVERAGADDRAWLQDFVLNQLDDPDVTLEDLYYYVQQHRYGQGVYVGNYSGFADFLERGLGDEVFDGVQLFAPYHRGPLDHFVDHVVPILQQRGIFRQDYESPTLEGNLGLAR